jgi:hypothetical protein
MICTGGCVRRGRGCTTVNRRDFRPDSPGPVSRAQTFIGNTVHIELDISMVDHDISDFVRSVLGRDRAP